VPLTFLAGSSSETVLCTPVTAVADQLIECGVETFTVVMALATAGASLSLGNNITAVTLTEDDGNTLHQNLR
jgi:hypothetical protein